jgi:hypothetical protein
VIMKFWSNTSPKGWGDRKRIHFYRLEEIR